ncbi:unnamed protein product [Discula destructiva]
MTTNIPESSISGSRQPEISQLKRKNPLGSSPSSAEGQGDAPSKRVKVEDNANSSAEPEAPREHNGSATNEHGDAGQGQSPAKDLAVEADSLSPETQRPVEANTTTPSPIQERRPLESSRRNSSSHARSPDQDRRPGEFRRRSRSPARSPDQDRRLYAGRRRDSSPRRWERRVSETLRRGTGSDPSLGDKDRTRRVVVNKEEEKKRGQRLFGGLLSTLSQTTTNSQQKRRQEIEKRQQEKAAKQKIEDDLRRNERLAKLDKVRKMEQVRFDEQVMRTRHSNMLAMARGLQTKSEPKLYYRPWELTQEQEDTIADQIRAAEAQIHDELQQFKRDKAHRLKELGVLPAASSDAAAVDDEPAEGYRSSNAAQDESAVTITNDRKQSPAPAPVTEDKDQGEMVEAEEDTVIY